MVRSGQQAKARSDAHSGAHSGMPREKGFSMSSAFVARQPLFDCQQEVQAYELLFRSGLSNAFDATDGDQATLDVIANSFLVIGFDELTDGRRAYINFTRDLILGGVPKLLPPHLMTVEILENIEPDEEILAACRELKDLGYHLAMDDFVLSSSQSPFLDLVDVVKVDFRASTVEQRQIIGKLLKHRKLGALAEKVETQEEFSQAIDWGYEAFQGYFFSKPVIHEGRDLASNKIVYLRIINEVNQDELDYEAIEELIKQDVAMTYKLLRFMNSAWFGFRCNIESIKHALVLLGPPEVRKWFSLFALTSMGDDKPRELLLRSMSRAKTEEAIASVVDMSSHASDLFLTGMFSLIDAIMDMPLSEVLQRLPLKEEVREALTDGEGPLRDVHDTVVAYEMGDWKLFSTQAEKIGLDEEQMPPVFNESLQWASRAFSVL